MKMAKILLASSLLVASAAAFAQGKPSAYTDADLVWKEDFDGKKLNTKDWNYEFHEPGWVNAELQRYDDSKKNTYLKDGCLVIQALKEEKKDGTVHYSSGRINTQGKHVFTYGRFEARLRVPKGKGFLPAFWMMPDDESYYGQWPKCGEIDIMEEVGVDANYVSSSLHAEGHVHSNHNEITHQMYLAGAEDDFHTYAIEWTEEKIVTYVDGRVQLSYSSDGTEYNYPYTKPFYIILNLAWGGDWGGYDGVDESALPTTMQVDYVRDFQKK